MPLTTREKTDTCRDKTGTGRDKTVTSRDKAGTRRNKIDTIWDPTKTKGKQQGQFLIVPVLSKNVPVLSLYVPAFYIHVMVLFIFLPFFCPCPSLLFVPLVTSHPWDRMMLYLLLSCVDLIDPAFSFTELLPLSYFLFFLRNLFLQIYDLVLKQPVGTLGSHVQT